ncbi:hypothetical protein [Nocardiopsis sp. NRRL B-16309]|nr:hypothetical protein [Nocardiopsis sp. NRRL B-16309]
MRISISWGGGSVTADLDSTPASEDLWAALPIESSRGKDCAAGVR